MEAKSRLARLSDPYEVGRRSLIGFTKLTYPSYKPDPVHYLIAAALDRVVDGEIKKLMIFAPPQHGKGTYVLCSIPTPNGYRTMQDLKVGDELFDEKGQICHVTAKSPVWNDMDLYKITTDDGDSFVVDKEHKFRVRLDRKHKAWTIRNTEYLFNRTSPRNPMIEIHGALELPEKQLPLDPYLLGVMLGDGSRYGGSVTADKKTGDYYFVKSEIEKLGYKCTDYKSGKDFGIIGLRNTWRQLGLMEKHIPQEYLRASKSQRLALLQGLLDTDGHCAPDGQVEFCNTNKNLALGVQELVWSLGVKAQLIEGRATLYGKDCGAKYRVMFYMENAFRMPRKLALCRSAKKYPNRYITIEKLPYKGDTQCIEVDSPSHLYLTGCGMTPTHNSELASVRLPSYYLGRFPDRPVIITSYNATLAESKSREIRGIIETNEEYQRLFPNVKTRRDSRAVNKWLIQGHRGSLLAAGAQGTITGLPAMLGIIDDPFAGWKEASSPKERDNVWNWYRGTFRTRIWEGGAIILIMTRWNEDDLAGRILAEQANEWTVLRLPAIAESEKERIAQDKFLNIPHLPFDPLDREEGEPLAPSRFSKIALAELRRDVGETAWAAEYMQVPRSMEGNMLKREWFSKFTSEVPKQAKRVRFWDKASSESDGSCFTAGVLVAMTGDGTCYIEDVVKGRWRPEEREKIILQTAELDRMKYNNTVKIWIEQEPGSSGVESSQISIKNLRGYPVYSEKPKGDKNIRLEPFSVQAANGNVVLKRGDWNGAWLEEICTVPNGKYRDQSDATSGAFNKLALRKNPSVGGRAIGLYGR